MARIRPASLRWRLTLWVAVVMLVSVAAIVISVIPVILAFLLAQRQFIAGIAAGAVKE